jgi:hypothetical protein
LKEVEADFVGARDETARIKNLHREFSVNPGICT